MLVCLILTGSMDRKVVDSSFNPDPAKQPLGNRPTVATAALSSLLFCFHVLYASHCENPAGELGVSVLGSREAETGGSL